MSRLSAKSIAFQGLGFGALAMAVHGFAPVTGPEPTSVEVIVGSGDNSITIARNSSKCNVFTIFAAFLEIIDQ
jgi:hypothetical protein